MILKVVGRFLTDRRKMKVRLGVGKIVFWLKCPACGHRRRARIFSYAFLFLHSCKLKRNIVLSPSLHARASGPPFSAAQLFDAAGYLYGPVSRLWAAGTAGAARLKSGDLLAHLATVRVRKNRFSTGHVLFGRKVLQRKRQVFFGKEITGFQ